MILPCRRTCLWLTLSTWWQRNGGPMTSQIDDSNLIIKPSRPFPKYNDLLLSWVAFIRQQKTHESIRASTFKASTGHESGSWNNKGFGNFVLGVGLVIRVATAPISARAGNLRSNAEMLSAWIQKTLLFFHPSWRGEMASAGSQHENSRGLARLCKVLTGKTNDPDQSVLMCEEMNSPESCHQEKIPWVFWACSTPCLSWFFEMPKITHTLRTRSTKQNDSLWQLPEKPEWNWKWLHP